MYDSAMQTLYALALEPSLKYRQTQYLSAFAEEEVPKTLASRYSVYYQENAYQHEGADRRLGL